MKRLLTICVILAVITGAGIWSLIWLGDYTESIAERMETVAAMVVDDEETALQELEDIQDNWHKTEHKIGIFIHEDPLEKLSNLIEESISLLRQKMYDDFQVKIRQTIFSVRNIYHQEVPNIENIL